RVKRIQLVDDRMRSNVDDANCWRARHEARLGSVLPNEGLASVHEGADLPYLTLGTRQWWIAGVGCRVSQCKQSRMRPPGLALHGGKNACRRRRADSVFLHQPAPWPMQGLERQEMQSFMRDKNDTKAIGQFRRLHQKSVKLARSSDHGRRLLLDQLSQAPDLGADLASADLEFGNLDAALGDGPHEALAIENMIDDQRFLIRESSLDLGYRFGMADGIRDRIAGARASQLHAAAHDIQHCAGAPLFACFERLARSPIFGEKFGGFVVNSLQLPKEAGFELLTAKFGSQRRARRKRLLVAVNCTLDLA